jgi:Amidase
LVTNPFIAVGFSSTPYIIFSALPKRTNIYSETPISKRKQSERASRLAHLPQDYHSPLTATDTSILSAPIAQLVADVHAERISPTSIIRAYGKVAVKAHDRTNCLTEVLFPEAEAAVKGNNEGEGVNLKGPLAGVPVSLKDSLCVHGFDTTIGYSRFTGQPAEGDGAIVKLLKEAGEFSF